MPEQLTVTFPNFHPGTDPIRAIGALGDKPGAYDQLNTAFRQGDDPEQLDPRTLIKRVAPSADFDGNIAHAPAVLRRPEVQRRLGYGKPVTADQAAYDIVEPTRLYEAVERPLMRPQTDTTPPLPSIYDYAVILEGKEGRVRGAARALSVLVSSGVQVDRVIGVSSGRNVTERESTRFPAGTPSDTMMRAVLEEELDADTEMLHTDERSGKAVAQVAADRIASEAGPQPGSLLTVVVPSAAGTWVEKGSVVRRALRATPFGEHFDSDGSQLFVAAGAAALVSTSEGTSPGRQRILPALGDVARSLMYFSEVA